MGLIPQEDCRACEPGDVSQRRIMDGLNHFLNPAPHLSMMPPYHPLPRAHHQRGGGNNRGAGILVPQTRLLAGGSCRPAGAVFPANLNVALHGWKGENIAPWLLWARLLFQPLLMALDYWAYIARSSQK
jgi:uncharacterized membrane protein